MTQSMTGFGAGDAMADGVCVRAEMRSVNHRHLDLRFRLPPGCDGLRPNLTRTLRAALGRGSVHLQVSVEGAADRAEVRVDEGRARAWVDAWRRLADVARTDAVALDPAWLAERPGVAAVQVPEDDPQQLAPLITAAAGEALTALVASREAEGARLCADLGERLDRLAGLHDAIATEVDGAVERYHDQLRAQLDALLDDDARRDEDRLAQEIALLAQRRDLTEELVRLRGHLDDCRQALTEPAPGRRLGFIAQELLREINTIGSKSDSLAITRRVVDAKVEIDKIREQAQNLA